MCVSRLNRIQSELKQLDGGKFQKLCDVYLYRKFRWDNIHSLGSMDGTDKTTKGIPDAYYYDSIQNQYILVMHGTKKDSTNKIVGDVQDAIQKSNLLKKDITKIICCHLSSNLPIDQDKKLRELADPIELELIGIDTLSQDLMQSKYQDLTKDYLGISKSTDQVWLLDQFIDIHDSSKTNAPLSNKYVDADDLISKCIENLQQTQALLLVGKSGTGKTRLAVEICKQLPHDANIICVKSNSMSAYQDIKDAIDDNRINYLLLDDSNNITNLNAVIALISLPSLRANLKIIMTVRDYALKRIEKSLNDIDLIKVDVEKSNDDLIKKLIIGIKGKLPAVIENRIIGLSQGNPRIAVLATMLIMNKGYTAFMDANSIIGTYYENILRDNCLSENESKTLLMLSFLTKVNFGNQDHLMDVLSFFKLTDKSFEDSIYSLHEKELCDIFNDKAVKVSDQSVKDYVLFKHIVIEKKLDLQQMFSHLYPKYEDNIILSLSSVNVIDSTKEWNDYIIAQLSEVFESVIRDQDKETFLTQFAPLLPLEAMIYINDKIEGIEYGNTTNISQGEIEKLKNRHQISDPLLNLIGSLSITERYDESAQLLMLFLEKCPDKLMEVYFTIVSNFGVEVELPGTYLKMQNIVNILKSFSTKGRVFELLCVNIAEEFLRLNGSKTNTRGRKLAITNYHLVDSIELRDLRKSILKLLATIYPLCDSDIRQAIEKLLMNFPISEINEGFSDMIQIELVFLENNFFDVGNITPRQENIISLLRSGSKIYGASYVPFSGFVLSERQEFYDLLVSRKLDDTRGEDFEKYESRRRTNIVTLFEQYNEKDLIQIFDYISFFIKDDLMKDYKIEDAVYTIFANASKERAVVYLRSLLRSDYEQLIVKPVYYYQRMTFDEVSDVLSVIENQKNISVDWQLSNLLRVENITSNYVENIILLIKEATGDIFKQHTILEFKNYIKFDERVLECLYCRYMLNEIDAKFFLPDYINEESAITLLELLSINKVKKMYLVNLDYNIDKTGQLFSQIIKIEDDEFPLEFLLRLSKSQFNVFNIYGYRSHLQSIIESPHGKWVTKKYLNYLIDENKVVYIGLDSILKIILKSDTSWSKLFLMEEMQSCHNAKTIIEIMNIASQIFMRETKLEFFSLLKTKQMSFEDLIKIRVRPLESSWSGSRVPLLDLEIEFLNDLLGVYTELKYVKYAKYLRDLKEAVQREKNKELIDEYIGE